MDVAKNIREIREGKSIPQKILADALNLDVAVISNIENGKRELKVSELEIISKCLEVSVIDLIMYPEKYINIKEINNSDKISVTFEISPDKRDYLLKLVTGEK